MTTHHTTSTGKRIAIADMNDYHLENAIKKLDAVPPLTITEEQAAHHGSLKAEQARRGGPPKPKEG